MTHQIHSAVILAAGMGRRLQNVLQDAPKGFIRLGERTIIEESIAKLQAFGINRILIVTGYMNTFYERLAKQYPGIETIHNAVYATSGSMYSLACAKAVMKDDFLLLESDLIYEKRTLKAALSYAKDNCIVLSGKTNSGDEVYVGGSEKGLIHHLSKKKEDVENVLGELVGVSKISQALFQEMLKEAENIFKENINIEYDSGCLARVAKKREVYACVVGDLLWAEVDNEDHLKRAKEKIYPEIIKRDHSFV
jgi:2-aminoethylphosphonate-pyruvate transaminase